MRRRLSVKRLTKRIRKLMIPGTKIFRVAVDMDIHGYIHGYIRVWIADLGCTMYISVDISTSFKDMISRHLVVPLTHSS